jgi:hypothetical protein
MLDQTQGWKRTAKLEINNLDDKFDGIEFSHVLMPKTTMQ